jgi:hypothetical protein
VLSISGVAANQRLDLAVDLTERLPATLAGLENGEIDLLRARASGTVLDYGRTTYKPPARWADVVRARDKACQFPRLHANPRTDANSTTAANTSNAAPTEASQRLVGRTTCERHYNGSARQVSGTPVAQNPFIDRR